MILTNSITNKNADINYVGVFVNHPLEEIITLAKELGLFAVQLHGQESQQTINELQQNLPNSCQIWKAIAVENTISDFPQQVEHIVLDGKQAGSGKAFNWQALAQTEQDLSSSLLAGGLNASNIEQAVLHMTEHDLFGLDINSGVESSPGIKCSEKLHQVFAKIRNY